MKLFKKLVAVAAVAAICITMTAPMSASAAVPGCTEDRHILKYELQSTTSRTIDSHQYLVMTDSMGGATVVTCYVKEITRVFLITCECGYENNGTETRITTEHSRTDCPVEE